MLPEIAPEFIQSLRKSLQIAGFLVPKVEIRYRFFCAFPLVCLAVAFLSDFFIQSEFNLLQSFRTDVLSGIDELPSPLEQIYEVLHQIDYYLLVLVGQTEVKLGIIIHEFLPTHIVIHCLSSYAVGEFSADVIELLSPGKDMGMLFSAVRADQCFEANTVRSFGIQFAIGCGDKGCDFLWDRVLDIFQKLAEAYQITLAVDIFDVADFLGGEEDTDFISEKIELMWRKLASVLRIEFSDELINIVEIFNALSVHLQLNFVEYLIGLVFPIHFWKFQFNNFNKIKVKDKNMKIAYQVQVTNLPDYSLVNGSAQHCEEFVVLHILLHLHLLFHCAIFQSHVLFPFVHSYLLFTPLYRFCAALPALRCSDVNMAFVALQSIVSVLLDFHRILHMQTSFYIFFLRVTLQFLPQFLFYFEHFLQMVPTDCEGGSVIIVIMNFLVIIFESFGLMSEGSIGCPRPGVIGGCAFAFAAFLEPRFGGVDEERLLVVIADVGGVNRRSPEIHIAVIGVEGDEIIQVIVEERSVVLGHAME